MAATKKVATKKPRATKAKVEPLAVFDPAKVPVLDFHSETFRHERRNRYINITELDGVGAAAIDIGENIAMVFVGEGKKIAYVGDVLCHVTTDFAYIEGAVREDYEGEEIQKAMAAYRARVGKAIDLDAVEFKHEHGTPHSVYEACEDQDDFDETDAAMKAKYARILSGNAEHAKTLHSHEAEFSDAMTGDYATDIVRFALAAIRHEEFAAEFKAIAYQYSDVFKAVLGYSKIDHQDPRYKAFTAVPWSAYIAHRGHGSYARSLLNQATRLHVGRLERDAAEMDSNIPF